MRDGLRDALARSDASASALSAAGATPLRGSIADLDVLRAGAEQADGVISLAFAHDVDTPDALDRSIAAEAAAMATLGEALVGSGKPMVTVSGTPWIAGRASTEHDPLSEVGPVAGRARSVTALLDLATRGVRASAVRMPRTVHENGEGGFAGLLTEAARARGAVGYPGDGWQRWPSVHARDAASLFRLALESAPAGTAWHAVADEGIPVSEIATVIARRLGVATEKVPAEELGPFGAIFAMDQPASSAHTREVLGWEPTHPGLLEDLENVRA